MLNYVIESIELLNISENVKISSFATIHVVNDTEKSNSFLSIGPQTYIGELNNIRAGGGKITIGKKCLISQHVNIIAANHSIKEGAFIMDQPWSEYNNFVTIGDNVWIGRGASILPGVKIGNGDIIGAGSVVTKDIPSNAIAIGVPAEIVKYRS